MAGTELVYIIDCAGNIAYIDRILVIGDKNRSWKAMFKRFHKENLKDFLVHKKAKAFFVCPV